MAVYYTISDQPEAIVRDGFGDPEGAHWFDTKWLRGVFLSDWPSGAEGDRVLEVVVPGHVNLSAFAIVEAGSVTEWCVPAAVINAHGTVRLLTQHEVDTMVTEWSYVRRSRGS